MASFLPTELHHTSFTTQPTTRNPTIEASRVSLQTRQNGVRAIESDTDFRDGHRHLFRRQWPLPSSGHRKTSHHTIAMADTFIASSTPPTRLLRSSASTSLPTRTTPDSGRLYDRIDGIRRPSFLLTETDRTPAVASC